MDRAPDHLFVYGTLRPALRHPMARLLEAGAAHAGRGAVAGRLYDLGAFPGAMLGAAGLIHGELYRLRPTQRLLDRLDAYEGCGPNAPRPTLFVRRRTEARTARGPAVCAWIYVLERRPARARPIPGGDFVAFRRPGRWRAAP